MPSGNILKSKDELKNFISRHPPLLHFLATLLVFICTYWGIEAELILNYTLFLVSAIILPGMAMLLALKGLDIEIPYLLGVSIAFGFILQSLNFFALSLTHHVQYYTATLFAISLFSIYLIFTNREFYQDRIKKSSFDFWNLTFYTGLILGLSLAKTKFAGPFGGPTDDYGVSPILGHYAWSPILEYHGAAFSEQSLSITSDFPYSTTARATPGQSQTLHPCQVPC